MNRNTNEVDMVLSTLLVAILASDVRILLSLDALRKHNLCHAT